MGKSKIYRKGTNYRLENQQLRLRHEEAEETLRAIREGEVDGLVINGDHGEQVFTLIGADHSYRLLIEDMNEGALILSSDGIILYCNRSFAKMMGTHHQEIIGASFKDRFFYPEDRPALRTEMDKNTGKVRREINLRKADGASLPVYFSTSPISVDGTIRYSLVITDLTEVYERTGKLDQLNQKLLKEINERRKVQEALRISEEMFCKAFHSVPIGMSINAIHENRFVDVNEAFCLMTGYKYDELIGHAVDDINMLSIDLCGSYRDQLLHQGRIENAEIILQTKSQEELHCRLWSELMVIDDQQCSISALIDVTEQIRVGKEMARLDRLNLIGEMAASIGHEIRNPMTAIKGFLQLLKENDALEDREYYEIMIEEIDRANKIISEYLNMAKNKTVILQPTCLNTVVEAIHPMMLADAYYQDKQIGLELGTPGLITADENEIRQLILNLARNGLEAMTAGGTLTIGTVSEEREIVLFVKDEGSGLAPEILDNIGTPFLTTKDSGTGLGLAVCYSIAARQNASIDLDTGSSGTTFYVHFPVITDIQYEDGISMA